MDNPDLTLERNAKRKILFMPNTGGLKGDKNFEINMQLHLWNKQAKKGKVFDSSTSFRLPNTAIKSPDASWLSLNRWDQLSEKKRGNFRLSGEDILPGFILELRELSSE